MAGESSKSLGSRGLEAGFDGATGSDSDLEHSAREDEDSPAYSAGNPKDKPISDENVRCGVGNE